MAHSTFSPALYTLSETGEYLTASSEVIIEAARARMDSLLVREAYATSPGLLKQYLSLKLGQLEYEVFAVVFLDAQHGIIEYKEMFRGSVTHTAVYPREVVKEALRLNASAICLAHQHPSGCCEPSRADEHITRMLVKALELVDVRVIDHFIVGGGTVLSFAERGLL